MAAIAPITGLTPPLAPAAASSTANAAPAGGKSFGNVLNAYVDNVNSTQQQAAQSVGDLMSGKENDMLPAVEAMAKADLSFKLLLGVRNKVIDAYKQTMSMQV